MSSSPLLDGDKPNSSDEIELPGTSGALTNQEPSSATSNIETTFIVPNTAVTDIGDIDPNGNRLDREEATQENISNAEHSNGVPPDTPPSKNQVAMIASEYAIINWAAGSLENVF